MKYGMLFGNVALLLFMEEQMLSPFTLLLSQKVHHLITLVHFLIENVDFYHL